MKTRLLSKNRTNVIGEYGGIGFPMSGHLWSADKKSDIINTAISLAIAMTAALYPGPTTARQYWNIDSNGGIAWNVTDSESHYDHIEMSGKRVATVLRYGVENDGSFRIEKSMVWPMLRTVPNNTHASLMRRFAWNPLDAVTINGRALRNEKVDRISIHSALEIESRFDNGRYGSWILKRAYFPSTTSPSLIEKYEIINDSDRKLAVEIPSGGFTTATCPDKGVSGSYSIQGTVIGSGSYDLQPGDTLAFSARITAMATGESPVITDADIEYEQRKKLVDTLMGSLVLETPDTVINRMMDFAKVRACESIFATRGGPMHGPGGESYYAAIWANDQAEYVNPFFPFTGYEYGNESALNSFRHFARFINDGYRPIPSSIIAEGDDIWNGAGDRGDAAMIAHGAARYALARGDRNEAIELWPLISWCLEYCRRNINSDGVVLSDSDELEGRFPTGDANLCTSSLYYDALVSTSYLAREIGMPGASRYSKEAAALRRNIDRYFAADVEGFDTYAYYKGNDVLRAWICIPLAMGIDERAYGTIDALFSTRLWTENGLLTEAGDKTFWDRSTLYALRGVFAVGATEKATDYLRHYSATRLLGEHVPYAIEAWPEGEQRHLSAESGLYGRIITEGLFGIRPTGLRSFTLCPRLPQDWDHMSLRKIKAFGGDFDIHVERQSPGRLKVSVSNAGRHHTYTVKDGKAVSVKI